jgi:hypothetical protein
LYVADKASGSAGAYGKKPGCGIIVATLSNTPTIDTSNAGQRTALNLLHYKGNSMQFADLYRDDNYAGMLMIYQGQHGGVGSSKWARLTTSTGVSLTTNLKTISPVTLKSWYDEIKIDTADRCAARTNLMNQARLYGVKVSAWLPPDPGNLLPPDWGKNKRK